MEEGWHQFVIVPLVLQWYDWLNYELQKHTLVLVIWLLDIVHL